MKIVASSENICKKLFQAKITPKNIYQPNFFTAQMPSLIPQQNILEIEDNWNSNNKLEQILKNNEFLERLNFSLATNYDRLSELIIKEPDKYEQRGDGTNGFIFAKQNF